MLHLDNDDNQVYVKQLEDSLQNSANRNNKDIFVINNNDRKKSSTDGENNINEDLSFIEILSVLLDENVLNEFQRLFQEFGDQTIRAYTETNVTDADIKVKCKVFIDCLSRFVPKNHVENIYRAVDVNDTGLLLLLLLLLLFL